MANINLGDTVYCRFTGEALTVVYFDGCVAVLRAADGSTLARPVGELSRRGA